MQIYENTNIEDITNEEWKDIKGYEGLYQVSNYGRVKSLERYCKSNHNNIRKVKARILIQDDKEEYLKITLSKNGKDKKHRVHKLVAEAFISNQDNKPTIDHINGNKYDNRVVNLRYATYKEQMQNEITKEKHKKASKEAFSKKVMCIQTGKIFNSTVEATEYYNITNKKAISSAANPNSKKHIYAGFILDSNGKKIKLEWQYIE